MRRHGKRTVVLSTILAGAFSLYGAPIAGATVINISGTDTDLNGIMIAGSGNIESITVTGTSTQELAAAPIVTGINVDNAHSYTNTMIAPGTISVTISGVQGSAYGLKTENGLAQGTSSSTVTGATNITVTGVDKAEGIVAEGNIYYETLAASNSVNADSSAALGKLTVTGTAGSSTGIYAGQYSSNNIGGLTDIIVKGLGEAQGIGTGEHSTNKITMAATGGNIEVTSTEGAGSGIYASEDSSGTITNLKKLTVTGTDEVRGLESYGGSTNNVTMLEGGGKIQVTATNGSACGMDLDDGGSATVNNLAELKVESTDNALGISVFKDDTNCTVNMIKTGGNIIAESTGTDGSAVGVATSDGKNTVTLNNVKNIEAKSSATGVAAGLSVYEGEINVTGLGPDISTVKASGSSGQNAILGLTFGGTINLTNIAGTMDPASTTDYAIYATVGASNANLNNSVLTGAIAYDADPAETGVTNALNISLTNNSILTGFTELLNYHNPAKNPKINMDLDSTSTWNITADSVIGTMTNNGTVAFQKKDSGFSKVTIDTLNGDGTYSVNTDLANNQGDTIAIGTSNNATANIKVAYDPAYNGATKDTVLNGTHTVLTAASGSSSITVKALTTDLGSIRFTPTIRDNGDGSFDITTLEGKEKFDPSENTMTAADARAVTDEAWFTTVNSLSKRMGDLRLNEKNVDGVWARFQRNNNKLKGDRLAKFNGNLYQVGYDKAFERKDGTTYVGLAVDYVDGTGRYENAGGDVKGTSVALYDTWIGNSGHYYDVVLRRGHFSNDYTVTDLSGTSSDADYGINATTLSGEYGYRKSFANGTYLEPQAEIIAGHLSGKDYTTGTGWPVSVDGYNHFITRLGIAAGRQFQKSNYYAKVSYYHDFAGGGEIQFDTYTYERDRAKNWGEFTLGGDIVLTKQSRVYGEVTKYFGDLRNSLNYNVGFMFNF